MLQIPQIFQHSITSTNMSSKTGNTTLTGSYKFGTPATYRQLTKFYTVSCFTSPQMHSPAKCSPDTLCELKLSLPKLLSQTGEG